MALPGDDTLNLSWILSNGGKAYLDYARHISTPYLLIMGVACAVGFIGNMAVLASIALNSKLHKSMSVFLVNLALADLWVTATGDPFSMLG